MYRCRFCKSRLASILLLDTHESGCRRRKIVEAEWMIAANRHTKWLEAHKEADSGRKETDRGSGKSGG